LDDVYVENREEIDEWRKDLREYKIDATADESTERGLDSIIDAMPEVKYSTAVIESDTTDKEATQDFTELANKYDSSLHNLSEHLKDTRGRLQDIEDRDKTQMVDKEHAHKIISDGFQQHKNRVLMENGILEYNLTKLMLEEAVDQKYAEHPVEGSLLTEDEHDLDEIIDKCKNYFKNINKVFMNLKKDESRVYTMDTDEINDWFNDNGYRYRCKD